MSATFDTESTFTDAPAFDSVTRMNVACDKCKSEHGDSERRKGTKTAENLDREF